MLLLKLASAPVITILFYIYIRDKYEKEPLILLFTGLFFGFLISVPIVFTENLIENAVSFNPDSLFGAFYISFAVASFTEEAFKFIVLVFLIWKNKNFNTYLDGIVYGVFVSLGFAWLENILYVLNPELGGIETALKRAFLSVPAHALFGVFMGEKLSLAKFNKSNKYIVTAFLSPLLLHGIYDFILLSGISYNIVIFAVFIIWLWIKGFQKINKFSQNAL